MSLAKEQQRMVLAMLKTNVVIRVVQLQDRVRTAMECVASVRFTIYLTVRIFAKVVLQSPTSSSNCGIGPFKLA